MESIVFTVVMLLVLFILFYLKLKKDGTNISESSDKFNKFKDDFKNG